MEKQEYFEKYLTRLKFSEDKYVFDPRRLIEDWKIIRGAFMGMAIELLPAVEKKVVKLAFYDHLTIREIAEKIGRSKSTAQRIKKRALYLLARSPFVRITFPLKRLSF